MSSTVPSFELRVRRLLRKHRRMAYGVVARMRPDGLIEPHPRRRRPPFPWRGLAMIFLVAMAYKSLVYAWLGSGEYGARVDALASGSLVEQFGGWMLQADPVTQMVGGWMNWIMLTL